LVGGTQGFCVLAQCPFHLRVMPRVARDRAGSGVVAQRGGEVDRPGPAEHADDEVAQAGHDLRAGPGPDLGGVLGEGHVADVVQAVLDRPMPTQQVGEPGGAGLGVGQARNRVDDHGPPPRVRSSRVLRVT
jgi:hypothetical protein